MFDAFILIERMIGLMLWRVGYDNSFAMFLASAKKNVGDVAWSIIKTSSESPAYFTIDDLMARGLVYLCCKRILIITTNASER